MSSRLTGVLLGKGQPFPPLLQLIFLERSAGSFTKCSPGSSLRVQGRASAMPTMTCTHLEAFF